MAKGPLSVTKILKNQFLQTKASIGFPQIQRFDLRRARLIIRSRVSNCPGSVPCPPVDSRKDLLFNLELLRKVRLSAGFDAPPRRNRLRATVMNAATASAFQHWVFERTVRPGSCSNYAGSGLEDRLALGRYAHRELALDRAWLGKTVVGVVDPSDWQIVFCDPHDDTAEETLVASRLQIAGQGMACRPDVVFRNRRNGHILIVERKTTGRRLGSIPENGWPNIRAQLWCYAWIDDWIDAPEVYLVCQFLKRRAEKIEDFGQRRRQNPANPWIAEFGSRPSWLRRDPGLNREIAGFFREYGGITDVDSCLDDTA